MADDKTRILTTAHLTGIGDRALRPYTTTPLPGLREAVSQHARHRDAATFAALRALLAGVGARLVEYELAPLSPAAMRWLSMVDSAPLRWASALRASLVAVTDAGNVRTEIARTIGAGGWPEASQDALDTITAQRGLAVVQELGAVAYRRGEVGEEEGDFYWPWAGGPRLAL